MAEKACRQNSTQFEAQRSEISLSFYKGAKFFLKLWKFYSLLVVSNFLPVNSFLTCKKWSHVMINSRFWFKVQLFKEGHKNVSNRPYGFEICLVNVKTMRTIAQIFVAFSEKLNFMYWWIFFLIKKQVSSNSCKFFRPIVFHLEADDSCHVLFELSFCWNCKVKK